MGESEVDVSRIDLSPQFTARLSYRFNRTTSYAHSANDIKRSPILMTFGQFDNLSP
jgi:hypothetical protein